LCIECFFCQVRNPDSYDSSSHTACSLSC
jgi:hypothetical protein